MVLVALVGFLTYKFQEEKAERNAQSEMAISIEDPSDFAMLQTNALNRFLKTARITSSDCSES